MSHLKRPVEETLAEKLAVKNKKTIQRQPPRNSHAQENANAQKTLTKTPTKLLQRPMDQAHEESWHMRISNKPLTTKVKLVLLVVNSVKLHLTAFIIILCLMENKMEIDRAVTCTPDLWNVVCVKAKIHSLLHTFPRGQQGIFSKPVEFGIKTHQISGRL